MPDNQVLNCHENFSQITKPRLSTIGRLWALGGKTMTTTRALQEILVSLIDSKIISMIQLLYISRFDKINIL